MRLLAIAALAGAVACGGTFDGPTPLVDEIPVAIDAVSDLIGPDVDLEFFEVSADRSGVTVVLAETAVDADSGTTQGQFATSYRWESGTLSQIGDTVAAEGATFLGSAVAIDSDVIFSGVIRDLDDPELVDLAVQGTGDGGVVIDISIENSKGGRLLVLVNEQGTVLGVQAA